MYKNPKQEAQDFIDTNLSEPSGLTAYVLEPSPPAQNTEPLFADLPLDLADPKTALTPTTAGSHQYDDFAELAEFASARFLGHLLPLPALPDNWIPIMEDMHRLAFGVISEARNQSNGKFGLRWVMGGFGTPYYGQDVQVRVVDGMVVLQSGSEVTTAPITTLKAAGDFLGVAPTDTQREHDSPELGDTERQLLANKECNDFLNSWFGFSTLVLEELRLKGDDPAPLQIWPGHFDVATEVSVDKKRCTLGASPGDEHHVEPYYYFSPHVEVDASDSFWNAKSFTGATFNYGDLLASGKTGAEQKDAAIKFFQKGLDLVKKTGKG